MKINKINVAQPIKERNDNASTPSFAGVTQKKVLLVGHAGLNFKFLQAKIAEDLSSHSGTMRKRWATLTGNIARRVKQTTGQETFLEYDNMGKKLLKYQTVTPKGKLKTGELSYNNEGKLSHVKLNAKTVDLSYTTGGKISRVETKDLKGKPVKLIDFNYSYDGKLVSKTIIDFTPEGKPKMALTKTAGGKNLELAMFDYDPGTQTKAHAVFNKYQDDGIHLAESTEEFFEPSGEISRKIVHRPSSADKTKLEKVEDITYKN